MPEKIDIHNRKVTALPTTTASSAAKNTLPNDMGLFFATLRLGSASAFAAGSVASAFASVSSAGLAIIFSVASTAGVLSTAGVEVFSISFFISSILSNFSVCTISWNPIKFFTSFFQYVRKSDEKIEDLFREYEDLFRATSLQEVDEVCSIAFNWDLFERCRRSKGMMDDISFEKFEDIEMPLPKDVDEILKKQYGDYMTPCKAPSLHGGFLVLDADNSYTSYLPEVRKTFIKNKVFNLLKKINV
jgi:hypothetical protein